MPKSRISPAWVMRMRRLQQARRQGRRHLGQRDVDRRRHHPQSGAGQHHHHPVHPRQMRQKLGMARKGETRPVLQRLLVDRRGADGRSRADMHQRTARSITAITPGGIGAGRAGRARPRQESVEQDGQDACGQPASGFAGSAIAATRCPRADARGSPIQTNGSRRPARPAFTAISGPMPDGSPQVRQSEAGGLVTARG